ncbi:MAG TPA: ABC transporter permease [Tepidisphaeraceae bacterium]|jgi:ABC-type transport system involved in multi-copper enzyme maturation permease subunit|nr:ABC transporter permease [Tepidisphaeraceae bacterium]
MHSLLWKEWHEQSWKLGFGCLVLGALALIGLHSRIIDDESMVMFVCVLGIALLPVLSSTGLVPAERSEGTLESFLALPVPSWRILAVKTAMGFLLTAGPLIFAGLVSILAAGGREMTTDAMFALYARSALAAISLFVWMLALTIRLPNETRAGLLALGLLIFWILATGGLSAPSVPPLVFGISPFAFVHGRWAADEQIFAAPPLAGMLIEQTVIAVLLWAWASRRLAGAEGRS